MRPISLHPGRTTADAVPPASDTTRSPHSCYMYMHWHSCRRSACVVRWKRPPAVPCGFAPTRRSGGRQVTIVTRCACGCSREGTTRMQPHDLSAMRAALNLVSVEPPPEATVNPDNIGIDLDGSSSELRSATVDAEPERVSTSPALVPRSPRLRSSRGENMERRPFPLSKKAGED